HLIAAAHPSDDPKLLPEGNCLLQSYSSQSEPGIPQMKDNVAVGIILNHGNVSHALSFRRPAEIGTFSRFQSDMCLVGWSDLQHTQMGMDLTDSSGGQDRAKRPEMCEVWLLRGKREHSNAAKSGSNRY